MICWRSVHIIFLQLLVVVVRFFQSLAKSGDLEFIISITGMGRARNIIEQYTSPLQKAQTRSRWQRIDSSCWMTEAWKLHQVLCGHWVELASDKKSGKQFKQWQAG